MALNEISELSDISWQTTNKYVNNLEQRGLIKPVRKKRKKVIFDFDVFG